MQISSTEEYGLRCALVLARSSEQLSASQIAEREGISVEYVSKLLHLFKKAQLVESVRGSRGGFRLAKAPNAVTVKEVFEAIQAQQKTPQKTKDFCKSHAGQQNSCVHLSDCSVRPMWTVLFSYFDDLLERIHLSDLMSSETAMSQHVERLAREKITQISNRLSSEMTNEKAETHA